MADLFNKTLNEDGEVIDEGNNEKEIVIVDMPKMNLPSTTEIHDRFQEFFGKTFKKIEEEVKSLPTDMSVAKNRDVVRSTAYKIAQTKTGLDKAAQELTEAQRVLIDAVNKERREMKETLDKMKEDARRPLTEWEEAEEERNTFVNQSFEYFNNVMAQSASGVRVVDMDSKQLLEYIDTYIKNIEVEEAVFGERAVTYRDLLDKTIADLTARSEKLNQEEQDRIELERLRAEREAKAAQEAEEKRQAEEKERIEAERKRMAEEAAVIAQREAQERIDAEKRRAAEAEERAAKAESDRIAAEKKAEADRLEAERQAVIEKKRQEEEREAAKARAVEEERRRQKEKEQAEQAAQAAREADLAHRQKINGAAVAALMRVSEVNELTAKTIVAAIADMKIPNVNISY